MTDSIKENTEYEFKSEDCKEFVLLVDKYCQSLKVESNSSQHTIRNYKNDLLSFAIWCDRMQISPVNSNYRQLRAYLGDMDNAQYARSTINRRLSSLRSFFKWLDIIGEASNNFAEVMSGPKILKTLPHVVRHNDMDKIMKFCMSEVENATDDHKLAIAKRDYAIFELLYASGARISEVANLELENINFDSGQVRLFGKGKKERIVPLYSIVLNALYVYIDTSRAELISHNKSENTNNLCFISNTGHAMSADNMRKMFYKKCEQAGVSQKISPHAMRHTFATDVLDGGADLRSVQEMLGHASLSTTQIYTHLSAKRLKDVHHQAHPRG